MAKTNMLSKSVMVLAIAVAAMTFMGTANAQEGATDGGLFASRASGIAIGAGLAVGLAGLATGLAQKDIGAAAVGAVAEDAGFLGRAILFIAIPETIVIFGVLIAFQLVGQL